MRREAIKNLDQTLNGYILAIWSVTSLALFLAALLTPRIYFPQILEYSVKD